MIQETLIKIQANPGAWATLILALYEFFVRLRPTKRNLSILAILSKLLPQVINLIPNKKLPKDITDKEKFDN